MFTNLLILRDVGIERCKQLFLIVRDVHASLNIEMCWHWEMYAAFLNRDRCSRNS